MDGIAAVADAPTAAPGPLASRWGSSHTQPRRKHRTRKDAVRGIVRIVNGQRHRRRRRSIQEEEGTITARRAPR